MCVCVCVRARARVCVFVCVRACGSETLHIMVARGAFVFLSRFSFGTKIAGVKFDSLPKPTDCVYQYEELALRLALVRE